METTNAPAGTRAAKQLPKQQQKKVGANGRKCSSKKVSTALRYFLIIGGICNMTLFISINKSAPYDDGSNEMAATATTDSNKGRLMEIISKNAEGVMNGNKGSIDNTVIKVTSKHPAKQPKDEDDNILRAYIEEPTDRDLWWNIKPLPIRNTTSESLKEIKYPQLNSCSRLLEQFPVDTAPVDDDPFLPWIHDVFPTYDGKYIQFVAQNRRRCRTGKAEGHIMVKMESQGALFQHVPIKRIPPQQKKQQNNDDNEDTEMRYRLSSHDEADDDGVSTRFICRFKPSMEETLSIHNVNYEFHAYRKTHKQLFCADCKDINSVYTSQLMFQCPVPEALQQVVREGTSVLNDYATLFVDIIPIRTPIRFGSPDRFFPPMYKDHENKKDPFNPHVEWGKDHILPRLIDSGRWANIPICKPPLIEHEPSAMEKIKKENLQLNDKGFGPKTHRLIGCVWASSEYHTRGERYNIKDGQRRLKEWLTYNFMTGFDHFYVYDNSAVHTQDSNLKPVTDLFPDKVTRVPWNAKICNNRPNNVDSPGERSSQYAAEASCKLRFGSHAEWIGAFDIDEYLVPMGKYKSVPELLDMMEDQGLNMLNFASYRAWPRRILIDKPKLLPPEKCGRWAKNCFDLTVPSNRTILQTYNCDRQPPGEKQKTMPAEKQLYNSDYVKLHFVHYSEVTELTQLNKTAMIESGRKWTYRIGTDPTSRFVDEINEGTMMHAKAVAYQDTGKWDEVCKHDKGFCRLGNPYPPGAYEAKIKVDEEGWTYNCWVNEKVENYWVPKLLDENPFLD